MTQRVPATPAPGPLEEFLQHFDDLFSKLNQREAVRRYLEGLLLPMERNKTLTGLANTEPIVGAQHASAQKLQWFLSESSWDPSRVNQQRLELLLESSVTAPTSQGALVIDETGDRKWGDQTAHVGRQYLGSIGKIENGVVSVHSLWADERRYYPLEVQPYTPARWFARGARRIPISAPNRALPWNWSSVPSRRACPSRRWWRTVSMGRTWDSSKGSNSLSWVTSWHSAPRMPGGIHKAS
jgi:SRSO17 transposase